MIHVLIEDKMLYIGLDLKNFRDVYFTTLKEDYICIGISPDKFEFLTRLPGEGQGLEKIFDYVSLIFEMTDNTAYIEFPKIGGESLTSTLKNTKNEKKGFEIYSYKDYSECRLAYKKIQIEYTLFANWGKEINYGDVYLLEISYNDPLVIKHIMSFKFVFFQDKVMWIMDNLPIGIYQSPASIKGETIYRKKGNLLSGIDYHKIAKEYYQKLKNSILATHI